MTDNTVYPPAEAVGLRLGMACGVESTVLDFGMNAEQCMSKHAYLHTCIHTYIHAIERKREGERERERERYT